MNAIVETINWAGRAFVEFALPMLIQSSVLILILLAVDVVLRRRVRAVFRYWIWMLVLVKLVLPPSLWSPVSIGTWLGETLEPPTVSLQESPAPGPAERTGNGMLFSGPTAGAFTPETERTEEGRVPIATPAQAVDRASPHDTASEDARPTIRWQSLVLLAWAAVVLALLLLLLQRAWFVRGLVAQTQEAPLSLKTALDQCRRRMGVARPISLRISPNASSPAVCGLLRPVILIPENLAPRLQPHDLQAVLLHELAHVKRGDLWVNLIQTLLQIVHFYNPLLWLANAMIRRTREQAVDEAVLVAMGETARDYPETLLHVAKLAFHRRPALSLRLIGVVESKSALRSRIKHILARPFPKTARLGIAGLIAIVAIAAVLLPMARAERDGMHVKGIDEILNVSDSAGHLTIQSLHMPAPDGKRLVEINETLLRVAVENTSPKDSYLGLEYYADGGTVAGAFSPGASARTEVLCVPANWQGTLTYSVAYPRFVHDGYIRIVLAKCSDARMRTERSGSFLPPDAEVLHKKKYPVFTAKPSQDSRDRFALLPDCGVWLSDIDGQDLPVLDLASERIITLPNVESDYDLVHRTGDRGEGDILYYYDLVKQLPKITFLRGAGFGQADTDETLTRTTIPLELPWQATLTTAEKASYEVRITRADEHGCAIYFHPVRNASDLPMAILPRGIAVELLGLSEHPSAGRKWWRPDGSPLDEAPQQKVDRNVHPRASETAYEFAVRLHDLPDGAAVTMKTDPGGSRTNGTGWNGLHWLATSLPKDLQECQLLVGIASEPWETTAKAKGESHSTHGTQLGGVMFSEALVSDGDGITITVTDDIIERPCRVVAIMKDGRTVVASPIEMGRAGRARQTAAHFKSVALKDIAEFQFQTRPWTWATFRNVSLKLGHKTNVAVDAQAAPEGGRPQVSETDASGVLPLTARAEKVLPVAEQEARRLNHDYVGTEHILLALARQEDAISAKVLANLGADIDTLRTEVNKFVRPSARATHASPLPRMPRAERAMQYAKEEARDLGHDYIGTEHILLALLRDKEGVAAQVLAELGITQTQIRTQVLTFIQPGRQDAEDNNDGGAGGGALVEPHAPEFSGVVAKLPNGVTVEFLAYSQLVPRGGLLWFDPQGQETTIPGVYEADVEGLGTVLAVRVQPPEAHLVAQLYRGPDSQNIEKQWQLPGTDIWLLPLGDERNFANLRIITELMMPAVIETIPLTEENLGQWVEVNRCGIASIVRLQVVMAEPPTLQFSSIRAPDCSQKVVAFLDKEGRTYPAKPIRVGSADGYRGILWPNRLAGIVVEAAPVHTADVRLRNISLTAQRMTEIQIETDLEPGRLWRFSRSWNRRDALPRSIATYRKDHGGRFPSGLEALRNNHDEDSFRWLLANIAYVGQGKSPDDDPRSVIAYDKTLLAQGRGTYVFYSDGKFEFESPVELAELGISISPETRSADTMPDAVTAVAQAGNTALARRVLDPNGAPSVGAQVAWIDADRSVSITDGRLMAPRFGNRGKGPIVETDERGYFRFEEEPNDGFSLLAAHDVGFALIGSEELARDRVVRLQRWGRIEGRVAEGREPAGDKIWMGGLPNSTWFEHRRDYRYETLCDSEGRFTFKRVPPGWFEVGYLVSNGDSSASLTSRTPVVVEPGETATVTLGGEGRPVVGRFVPPSGWEGPIYFGAGLRALDTARADPPRPADYDQMTNRQQQEWLKQWYETPEAREYRDAIWQNPDQRHYTFRIADDGTFRIEDVIPGRYSLTVWLEERFSGGGRPEEFGGYSGTVEVPPMDEAYSDKPLDAGDLVLRMRRPLHVGDMAPLFEARTLDGKEIRLADYRGRFVLLSFWSPVFNPELDRLKELHATYGPTGQLQIIGLGGTDTLDEVKKYVEERDIEWPELYFGPDWDCDLLRQLGGQMQILLIDPDGKVVATWLREEKLTDTVRKALAAFTQD
ncbi:M56 family metallopeptidase [Anaerobaca lacustris]|uniref:M56 family metallopeptidase n=1 Tax=Anaerobaca lacustris TaxID=3044600 RepID=A0AAW6U0E6_9BACT|nr:M56 family metallopeptidase [Sedimentisphaerales bacterium M17dextr]